MTEAELRRQRARAAARKFRYGITDEEYNDLLESQQNRCAICEIEFSEVVGPNVDHDHNCCLGPKSCGKCLRGLLCIRCLNMASLVETRFDHMDRTFIYLTNYLNKRGE